MTMYFIDRYKQETSNQNVDMGLSIYGKGVKRIIIGLIFALCASALAYAISLIVNDIKKEIFIPVWVSIISFIVLVLSAITLAVISNRFYKKAVDKIGDNLHKRFESLEKVIRVMYYTETDKDRSKDGKVDVAKIKELILLYQDEIDTMKEEGKHRIAIITGALSFIGTFITTVFSEMDVSALNAEELFKSVALLLILSALIALPLYFINMINSSKDKYQSMLNLLRQYLVYVVKDDTQS